MTLQRWIGAGCVLALVAGCGSNSTAPTADVGVDSSVVDSSVVASEDAGTEDAAEMDAPATDAADAGAPGTFALFDHIPMFNMYSSTEPTNFTPPAGVLQWSYGTEFVTKLTAEEQSLIGSDLAATITYYAGCDSYDRIGGVFFVIEPTGRTPQPTDPRIELVRFITPFSDYTKKAAATHVFPNGDLSAFANVLADGTHDIWVGIGGGSYPTYTGNWCTGLKVDAGSDFTEIGFSYSLSFVSTKPLSAGTTTTMPAFVAPAPPGPPGTDDAGSGGGDDASATDGSSADAGVADASLPDAAGSDDAGAVDAGPPVAISDIPVTSTPIYGSFINASASPLTGHVTVIVSGHGSAAGGDEYEFTEDTVSVGTNPADAGAPIGKFSTAIDCSSYASASPDCADPALFQDTTTRVNPRNWCPGALVPSHTFPVTLPPGSSTVVLGIDPAQVPSGSYFQTSITFTSP